MARRYYRKQNEEETIGFLILFVIICIVRFISEHWKIILIVLILILILFLLIRYRSQINKIYHNHYLKKLKKKSQLYYHIEKVNSKYDLSKLNDFIDYYPVRFKSDLETCNIDNYLMMTIHNKYDELLKYKKEYDLFSSNYQLYEREYMDLKKYINKEEAKK